MPLPAAFAGRLRVPIIAAPMFLISGPDLVVSCCRNGVVGSFPALNQRTTAGFADWLDEIEGRLGVGGEVAPFGVNLVVHRSNPRLEADLAVVVERKVPLVIRGTRGRRREFTAQPSKLRTTSRRKIYSTLLLALPLAIHTRM